MLVRERQKSKEQLVLIEFKKKKKSAERDAIQSVIVTKTT